MKLNRLYLFCILFFFSCEDNFNGENKLSKETEIQAGRTKKPNIGVTVLDADKVRNITLNAQNYTGGNVGWNSHDLRDATNEIYSMFEGRIAINKSNPKYASSATYKKVNLFGSKEDYTLTQKIIYDTNTNAYRDKSIILGVVHELPKNPRQDANTVYLNTQHYAYSGPPTAGTVDMVKYNRQLYLKTKNKARIKKNIIIHEILHTLGLDHAKSFTNLPGDWGSDNSSIMNSSAYLNDGNGSITTQDKKVIKLLFPYPGTTDELPNPSNVDFKGTVTFYWNHDFETPQMGLGLNFGLPDMELEIARDRKFENIVLRKNAGQYFFKTVQLNLEANTKYYWRAVTSYTYSYTDGGAQRQLTIRNPSQIREFTTRNFKTLTKPTFKNVYSTYTKNITSGFAANQMDADGKLQYIFEVSKSSNFSSGIETILSNYNSTNYKPTNLGIHYLRVKVKDLTYNQTSSYSNTASFNVVDKVLTISGPTGTPPVFYTLTANTIYDGQTTISYKWSKTRYASSGPQVTILGNSKTQPERNLGRSYEYKCEVTVYGKTYVETFIVIHPMDSDSVM